MQKPLVSLFASSKRPILYPDFFKSLEGTSVPFEVVFAGPLTKEDVEKYYPVGGNFHFITTENIKPAQCYEIARRHCAGEVVVWVADDCEFPNDVIGKAYNFWKTINNVKLILSIQTKESGYGLPVGALFDMKNHAFFGFNSLTPLMAPLGLMSRDFLEKLGGLDRRYICGQYENDIVMRAMAEGGKVEIFGNHTTFIDIDHLKKSYDSGEITRDRDFLQRPFAAGYPSDRRVLEASWSTAPGVMNKVGEKYVRLDSFEPYQDTDLYKKSQSNNIKERWE